MSYLTVFCLTFQAFVQLLWSDKSYTSSHWILGFCGVPSRQLVSFYVTCVIFPCNSCLYNYVACSSVYNITDGVVVLSHNPQWSPLMVDCRRCNATWKLVLSLHQPSFWQVMHDQSEAMQGVSALRAHNKANVDTRSQSRRNVVSERDNSPLFYLLPLRFYGKTITKGDRARAVKYTGITTLRKRAGRSRMAGLRVPEGQYTQTIYGMVSFCL